MWKVEKWGGVEPLRDRDVRGRGRDGGKVAERLRGE
jgi:hypothetical protein